MFDRDHSDGESEETVRQHNTDGTGHFLFVCEHASNRIPAGVDLGVDDAVLASHAAWDPGAYRVASGLAERFDAPLISGGYSRLVYDLNRPPTSPEAMRSTSEIHAIPGNAELSEDERRDRTDAFYRPFHGAVSQTIMSRKARGQATALVTIHTFTPVYFGEPRSVELGILHDADDRLAGALMAVAASLSPLDARRNEPYGAHDGVTHTLAEHALPHGLHNVMIEIRNDLVADEDGQRHITTLLGDMLSAAHGQVHAPPVPPAIGAIA